MMDTICLTDGTSETHNPPSCEGIQKNPSSDAKWFGDPFVPEPISVQYGPESFLNWPFMSTGIIAQYTDQGFVIAADSLRKHLTTGEDVSEKVQKIFNIEERENRRSLAYALAGAPEPEIFSGSKFIRDKIWKSKDKRFAMYRTPSVRASQRGNRLIPPKTLAEAKTMVVNYLQACIDNRELDPDKECDRIGGQIFALAITPDGKFDWFRKPPFMNNSDVS